MNALLIAIVTWLSSNMELPATYDLPAVRFAKPMEIAFLHHQASTPEAQKEVLEAYSTLPDDEGRAIVAVYDTISGTIVLPEGWQGRSPAELSMLVHEMVHHLQVTSNRRYACPAERERLAYEAQEKWLGLFNTSLQDEFGIDALTLLVTTRCGM